MKHIYCGLLLADLNRGHDIFGGRERTKIMAELSWDPTTPICPYILLRKHLPEPEKGPPPSLFPVTLFDYKMGVPTHSLACFSYKMGFIFQNNPKDLNSSFMMYQDL